MEYSEFISELNRISSLLARELRYYKESLVFYSAILSYGDEEAAQNILDYITELFKDIIDDNEVETMIIKLIGEDTYDSVIDMTEFFFEDTDRYDLYVQLVMKISNSVIKRVNDTVPEIQRLFAVVTHVSLYKNNYKGVKRKKYISESEYNMYLQTLKK